MVAAYDKTTEWLDHTIEIPKNKLTEVYSIVDVDTTNDSEFYYAYRLDDEDITKVSNILKITLKPNLFDYFLECYAIDETDKL
jgi:hypothetical protein